MLSLYLSLLHFFPLFLTLIIKADCGADCGAAYELQWEICVASAQCLNNCSEMQIFSVPHSVEI